MAKAWLAEDWKELDEAGSEFIRRYPTHYDWQYLVGVARARLGRREPAMAALQQFTQHSRDELRYPEALNLLRELQSDS